MNHSLMQQGRDQPKMQRSQRGRVGPGKGKRERASGVFPKSRTFLAAERTRVRAKGGERGEGGHGRRPGRFLLCRLSGTDTRQHGTRAGRGRPRMGHRRLGVWAGAGREIGYEGVHGRHVGTERSLGAAGGVHGEGRRAEDQGQPPMTCRPLGPRRQSEQGCVMRQESRQGSERGVRGQRGVGRAQGGSKRGHRSPGRGAAQGSHTVLNSGPRGSPGVGGGGKGAGLAPGRGPLAGGPGRRGPPRP